MFSVYNEFVLFLMNKSMFETLEHKFGTFGYKFETLEHKFDTLEHRFYRLKRTFILCRHRRRSQRGQDR